jgi:chromosome segregation ATPase
MPDPLGPGGWAYWRERFTRADAERTHLRAEVEQQRKQWEDIWRRNVDLLAEIERLRRALEPFAKVASEWDGEPESLEVELRAYDDRMCPGVSVADFRLAREALANGE